MHSHIFHTCSTWYTYATSFPCGIAINAHQPQAANACEVRSWWAWSLPIWARQPHQRIAVGRYRRYATARIHSYTCFAKCSPFYIYIIYFWIKCKILYTNTYYISEVKLWVSPNLLSSGRWSIRFHGPGWALSIDAYSTSRSCGHWTGAVGAFWCSEAVPQKRTVWHQDHMKLYFHYIIDLIIYLDVYTVLFCI